MQKDSDTQLTHLNIRRISSSPCPLESHREMGEYIPQHLITDTFQCNYERGVTCETRKTGFINQPSYLLEEPRHRSLSPQDFLNNGYPRRPSPHKLPKDREEVPSPRRPYQNQTQYSFGIEQLGMRHQLQTGNDMMYEYAGTSPQNDTQQVGKAAIPAPYCSGLESAAYPPLQPIIPDNSFRQDLPYHGYKYQIDQLVKNYSDAKEKPVPNAEETNLPPDLFVRKLESIGVPDKRLSSGGTHPFSVDTRANQLRNTQ